MKLLPERLYHVYNQGNNKEPLFKDSQDHLLFLNKIREHMVPVANIVAYCLMPNHFHFLIDTNHKSIEEIKIGSLILSRLTNAFRLMQSEYAQDFNRKYTRTGSLFRQKTKYKELETGKHAFVCFHYIHQNPLKAGLVKRLENLKYSSFKEYAGIRNGKLPQKELASNLIGISLETVVQDSYLLIDDGLIDELGLEF
jgi:putative transposase